MAVMAALLHQGRCIHLTALTVSLVPLANVLANPSPMAALAAVLALAALAVESYYAIRTGIDAELFGRLGSHDGPVATALAVLDRGLGMAGFDRGLEGRSLADRISGSHKLLRSQCLSAAIPFVLAIAVIAGVTRA